MKGADRFKLWNPTSALLLKELPPLDFILWPGFAPSYKDCKGALRAQQGKSQDRYGELVLGVVENVLKNRIGTAVDTLECLNTWNKAPVSILLCVLVLWLFLHNQDLSLANLQSYKMKSRKRLKQGLRNCMFSYERTYPRGN